MNDELTRMLSTDDIRRKIRGPNQSALTLWDAIYLAACDAILHSPMRPEDMKPENLKQLFAAAGGMATLAVGVRDAVLEQHEAQITSAQATESLQPSPHPQKEENTWPKY